MIYMKKKNNDLYDLIIVLMTVLLILIKYKIQIINLFRYKVKLYKSLRINL